MQNQLTLEQALRTVHEEGFLSVYDGDVVWTIPELVRCLKLSDKPSSPCELERNVQLVNNAESGYYSILMVDQDNNEWTEFYRCFGHYGRCSV